MITADAIDPIACDDWHRVKALRPRWHSGTQARRHWVRGQRWYTLTGTDEGAHCRLNTAAYEIVARMDGHTSMGDLWSLLACQTTEDHDVPSRDELVRLLLQLMRLGLVDFDTPPDLQVGGQHRGKPELQPQGLQLGIWRLKLGDPSPWLDPSGRWSRRMASIPSVALIALALTWLCYQSLAHADALAQHTQQWLAHPSHMLVTLMCVPVMKLVHELAHGLAVRRWGGQVHRWGVALVYGLPMPYVDASASHSFTRSQRLSVSAAGIVADLLLAAVGLWVWTVSPPGTWSHVGHALWLAGCVSSLLVNANPLLRQDGYHLLTDLLDLPNLAPRSTTWWHTRIEEWVRGRDALGAGREQAPDEAQVRLWLAAYAPLAWLWQFVIWGALAAWMASFHPALGIAVGLLAAWTALLQPARRLLQHLWQAALLAPAHHGRPHRAFWRLGVIGLVLLALPWLPIPDRHAADGILSPPDAAWLRAGESGFLEDIVVRDGAQVHVGQPVARLRNPHLLLEIERLGSELRQAQQLQYTHLASDPARAGQAEQDVARIEGALQDVQRRLDALTIKARRNGRLSWPDQQDQPGRYVKRGDAVGHVVQGEAPRVLLAIDADRADAWRHAAHSTITVHGGPGADNALWHATPVWQSLGATRTLPHPLLSADQGGPIATRPTDPEHRETLLPVVLIELQLEADARSLRLGLGHRVSVRIDRGWTPLLLRLWSEAQAPWRRLLVGPT